ncbi:MAG: hypothetical protein J6Z09_03965 [Lachnospiraceae bacterium]|nr:hypothetical protein [Lachnospiraceae bacterium]
MITYDLLSDKQEFLKNFNKKNYEPAFKRYKDKLEAAVEGMKVEDVEASVDSLYDKVKEEEATLKRRQIDGFHIDLRVIIALYLVPAAKEIDTDVSNLLSEKLVEKWNERFPEPHIEGSTFEVINGGFKKSIGEMFGFKSLR